MPKLSVIVVTTNEIEDILCIPVFEKSSFHDYELIVRTDDGIARARNEGVKEASSDKLLFLDDDALPVDGYLNAAYDVLERESVVAGRVDHPGEGPISHFASVYPNDDEGRYIDHVIGCNMGFRREVFDEIGYFDENFNWGGEETEFINRVKTTFPVYYEPEMRVTHPYASSVIDYWKKRYKYGPADVYRARKDGRSDLELLKELINPLWYFNSNLQTLPIFFIGRICLAISRFRAIRGKSP